MKCYVFLIQRNADKEPWARVYDTSESAEKALGRVSAIAEVEFDLHSMGVSQPEVERLRHELSAAEGRLAGIRQGIARGESEAMARQIATLQEQLASQVAINQDIARVWKQKVAEANQEVRLRSLGKVSSACSCPIGTCLAFGGTVSDGACWFQWAEGYILKRAGEIRLDFLRQAANHPARLKRLEQGRGDEPLMNPEK